MILASCICTMYIVVVSLIMVYFYRKSIPLPFLASIVSITNVLPVSVKLFHVLTFLDTDLLYTIYLLLTRVSCFLTGKILKMKRLKNEGLIVSCAGEYLLRHTLYNMWLNPSMCPVMSSVKYSIKSSIESASNVFSGTREELLDICAVSNCPGATIKQCLGPVFYMLFS